MEKYRSILINTVIGDALGSPFEGMSRKHIASVFKTITDYTDPEPAIRRKPEKWKKPGLYSSISQLMLTLGMTCRGPACRPDEFISFLRDLPEIENRDCSIFRNPGAVEINFISGTRNRGDSAPHTLPCSRILALAVPLSHMSITDEQLIINCISIVKLFTADAATISGTILFSMLMRELYAESSVCAHEIISHALSSCRNILALVNDRPGPIFRAGVNPDTLTGSLEKYTSVLEAIDKIPDFAGAEKTICDNLNSTLKTPVTRATVNHPLSVIPFCLYMTKVNADSPGSLLFTAAAQGGSSASMASLTGALLGSLYMMESTPELLVKNLVNRKRILAVADSIAMGRKTREALKDFIHTEAALTEKEQEEIVSRLRHTKQKNQLSRENREAEMTRHVVESWTKIDRARWKSDKTRKHNPKHDK